MPQLFIEFFSEEIPARMQTRAADDLLRLLEGQLNAAGLKGESAKAFAGPRRLAVVIEGLPERTPDLKEERKGPRVGAPEQALAGFLKAAGLSSIEEATVQEDPKGAFYVARIDKPGRATADIVAEALPTVAKSFPWPKSMRSGEQDFYWVRPLQSIVALFNNQIVPCEIGGIAADRLTRGHRFHAPSSFEVSDFEDYAAKLRAQWVVLDTAERKALILERANKLCKDAGLEMVEDAGLLDEVAGLVEWPVPVLGKMDPAFLDLPAEVIRLSMRTHQKYFAVWNPQVNALAPNFVTVANIDAIDSGKAIAAGNARVLSARLNDARYFWDLDRFYDPIERTKPKTLDAKERGAKLEQIVFHQKLGTIGQKVRRIRELAKHIIPAVEAKLLVPNDQFAFMVDEAARLSKMDLTTETVGEFPELQGQIGHVLANRDLQHPQISAAIEQHYKPVGPSDRIVENPVAFTVALADKIDSLVVFDDIGERATGSKDPYALRRAALGVIRILREFDIRLPLSDVFAEASRIGEAQGIEIEGEIVDEADSPLSHIGLIKFMVDRLKVQLRDQGKRHDLVDAALKPGGALDDDLVRIVRRVEALEAFLKTDDGANLLAGYKRAVNILRAEEKKTPELIAELSNEAKSGSIPPLDGEGGARSAPGGVTSQDTPSVTPDQVRGDSSPIEGEHGARTFALAAERDLAETLDGADLAAQHALNSEDFAGAMGALARLRAPVDAFFEQVLVNDPDPMLRRSRLLLLSKVRAALERVADFSQIEG